MNSLKQSVWLGAIFGLGLLTACQNSTTANVSSSAKTITTTVTSGEAKTHKPAVIFLVRHAEKMKDSSDPALTEAGHARSALLAKLLKDAKIEHIHSSNYKRTMQTAAPLAEALNIEVQLYDPRDLPAIALKLRQEGGRHLVVGHSNTTPQLTELLGGEGGTPIVEATEYDRLYFVNLDARGDTSSTMLRFGEGG
jgi:phosphohistidine phosphatase SixA